MKDKKEKQILPKLTPKFLNDNKLWDSQWLEKTYPENFKNN